MPLADRLKECVTVLKATDTYLGKHKKVISNMVDPKTLNILFEISGSHNRIEEIIKLIDTRESSMKIMLDLHKAAIPIPVDHVKLCGNDIHFKDARLLLVQGYINTVWAIADNITDIAGRIACSYTYLNNKPLPAKLVSTFLAIDSKNSSIPHCVTLLTTSLREGFGWPILLSYEIRNIFTHDGGINGNRSFFDGDTISSEFRINMSAWDAMIEAVKKRPMRLNESMTKAPEVWPWPKGQDDRNDLRDLLIICNREMDGALGVLMGTACDVFKSHVAYLYGVK
jgi:hypothetical protein